MADYEERSIIFERAYVCGDHAVEYLERDFRSPQFEQWLEDLVESSQPLMGHSLQKTEERRRQGEGLPGCAPCWARSVVAVATYFIELKIDGDG